MLHLFVILAGGLPCVVLGTVLLVTAAGQGPRHDETGAVLLLVVTPAVTVVLALPMVLGGRILLAVLGIAAVAGAVGAGIRGHRGRATTGAHETGDDRPERLCAGGRSWRQRSS